MGGKQSIPACSDRRNDDDIDNIDDDWLGACEPCDGLRKPRVDHNDDCLQVAGPGIGSNLLQNQH